MKIPHTTGLNTPHRFFAGYRIAAACFFILMVTYGVRYAFGVFFTPLLTEFGWSSAMTSGILSVQMITEGVLAIGMGFLADRFGPRRTLSVAAVLIGAGYVGLTQVTEVWHIYLLYGLVIGTGLSTVMVSVLPTISRWFVARRGLITGIVMASAGIGTLISSPAANYLIQAYNWRISFAVLGIVSFVVLCISAQFMRREPAELGLQPYGYETEPDIEKLTAQGDISLRQALGMAVFWMAMLSGFMFGFAEYSMVTHLVPHALLLGISPSVAAGLMSMFGVIYIAGRILVGIFSDKYGSPKALGVSFFLLMLAFIWVLTAEEVWSLYLFAAVFGFAVGGIGTLLPVIVSEFFGGKSQGTVLGFMVLSLTIGSSTGPLVCGYTFDISQSYFWSFIICGIVCLLGVILAVLLDRQNRQPDTTSAR